MQLEILSPSNDGFVTEIKWNNEELKQELIAKVDFYNNLVYTDGQIKEAKADRAKLKKLAAAIDEKRKEIKKQCLAPYNKFESECKELLSILDEPILAIDTQVKGYEEKCKQEKAEKVIEIYNGLSFPEFVNLEQIYNPKWLNASVSLKSITEELESKKTEIESNLVMLEELPDFGFEASEVYKRTLDLQKAVNEAKTMSEIAKRKAEAEKKKAEEQQEQKAAVEVAEPTPIKEVAEEKPQNDVFETLPPQWISFRALLTVNQATALKEFCNNNNIKIEPLN